jgi:hypothetical protein
MKAERKCYACGEKGQHANRCRNPRPLHNQLVITTPAPTCGANFVFIVAKQSFARRRVKHVVVEEDQKALDVVLGVFFVIDTAAVVLFYSGASHSFISVAYVDKHNLPIALLKCPMLVSSLGADMPARQLCPRGNLKIRGGVNFVANLIVLELKGNNVIPRMD